MARIPLARAATWLRSRRRTSTDSVVRIAHIFRSLTRFAASMLMETEQSWEKKVCAWRTFWMASTWWSLLSIALFALPLSAQETSEYPSRTIRIIVGFTPGGAPDVTARVLAQSLQ